jgi:hypothetical protein
MDVILRIKSNKPFWIRFRSKNPLGLKLKFWPQDKMCNYKNNMLKAKNKIYEASIL